MVNKSIYCQIYEFFEALALLVNAYYKPFSKREKRKKAIAHSIEKIALLDK